jgi:predicted transcriptional regulator
VIVSQFVFNFDTISEQQTRDRSVSIGCRNASASESLEAKKRGERFRDCLLTLSRSPNGLIRHEIALALGCPEQGLTQVLKDGVQGELITTNGKRAGPYRKDVTVYQITGRGNRFLIETLAKAKA